MGLSTMFLLTSVCAGVLGGVLVARRHLLLGIVAAAIVACIGVFAARSSVTLGLFGLMHLVYLLGTVTVPMMCVGLAVRWRRKSRLGAAVLVGLGALGAGIGLYASYIEPFWLNIERQVISSPKISEPIRLVVLSDIQNSSVGDWEYEVFDAILAEEPDLVLMAGDLWQVEFREWPQKVDEFAALIDTLAEEVPVLMVDGDSDWADGYDDLVRQVGPNALFLYDDAVVTTVRGQRILIAGAARFPESLRQRQEMFDIIGTAPDDVMTVLLAHRPAVIYELTPEQRPDLTVAGHTHGGQVSVPLFGPPITFSTVPRDVAAGGLHEVDGTQLYVTPGVGVERGQSPQLRFRVRPSFGVIDLVPE